MASNSFFLLIVLHELCKTENDRNKRGFTGCTSCPRVRVLDHAWTLQRLHCQLRAPSTFDFLGSFYPESQQENRHPLR